MSKDLDFKKGYSINTTITCTPVAVRPYNENANKKGAQLQAVKIGDKGLESIDIKIESAKEDDLERFLNQTITINNVTVTKVDFNTYYSVRDISCITPDNKQNSNKGA